MNPLHATAASHHPLVQLDEAGFDPFANVPVVRRTPDVAPTLEGLRVLAVQGLWRVVSDKAKVMVAQADTREERLSATTYYVLALTKLRMYGSAADELRTLDDLEGEQYQVVGADGRRRSVAPFALRLLQAELFHRLGQPAAAVDLLFRLLDTCRQEAKAGAGGAAGGGTGGVDLLGDQLDVLALGTDPTGSMGAGAGGGVAGGEAQRWVWREELVLGMLLNHYFVQRDFLLMLRLLNRLLREREARDPGDPNTAVWSRVGYVQLQMGDVDGAAETFKRVEAAATQAAAQGDGSPSPLAGELQLLVLRNEGLLRFARKDYPGALDRFQGVLDKRPTDTVAASNKALCLMYSCNLIGAIRALEDALHAHPLQHLDETLILNLCSMYELVPSSVEKKRRLSAWVSRFASEDFDLTATRL